MEQYTGPLQYELFTVGKTIMFRFKLPKGQDKPANEALEIMRSHKQTLEGQPTGLRFEDTRMHGKVWTIPNDPEGRELAGKIEMELAKVARKMEATPALPGAKSKPYPAPAPRLKRERINRVPKQEEMPAARPLVPVYWGGPRFCEPTGQ